MAAMAALAGAAACSSSPIAAPGGDARSAHPRTTPPSPSASATTTTTTAEPRTDFDRIRALMSARAQAVLGGHEKAFLALVDKADPAFYASEKTLYTNLQRLPVSSMRYEVADYALNDAPGIHGGPLLTPDVFEHVFLGKTDRLPMSIELKATFVKRNGSWLLAADEADDLQSGPNSARPWDGPLLDVVSRGHLVVVADASSYGLAEQVADTVQSDLEFDASVLSVPVDDHLLVDATTSGSVDTFTNNESAAAVTFAVPAGSDLELTSLAGMRVKVAPKYVDYLSREPALLRHELTHYLMWQYGGSDPTWLNEGIAEYVSHRPGGLATEYISDEAYTRLIARPHDLTVSGRYGEDPSTDYPLAMACVTYLVDHGGIAKVEQLMKAYQASGVPLADQETDRLLRSMYGFTGADLAEGAFALLNALR